MSNVERVAGRQRRGAVETDFSGKAEFSAERSKSILIASDRQWTREVLLPALLAEPGLAVVGQLRPEIRQIGEAIQALEPQIVVLDCKQFAEGVPRELTALLISTRLVLLLSAIDDGWADRILGDNVSGILLEGTSGPSCVSALRRVGEGDIWLPRWLLCQALLALRDRRKHDRKARETTLTPRPLLTPREREIAALVAVGLSNKEVAWRVKVSIDTVKKHLKSIYAKFRVHRRAALSVILLEHDQKT